MIWSICSFHTALGEPVFKRWYDSQNASVRASLDATLEFLETRPNNEWKRPEFASLSGHKGIFEIRFKARGVQFRPLGCFGPTRQSFTLLVGASKKEDVWEPRAAILTATARMKEVARNPSQSKRFR